MLAEQDFMRQKAYEDRTYLAYENCLNFNQQLKIFAQIPNRFFRINTLIGEEAIVYSKHSNVFLPQCKKVYRIEIIADTAYCFENIPVIFLNKNKTINGYLTNEKVIKLSSQVTQCTGKENLVELGNETYIKTLNRKSELIIKPKLYRKVVRLNIYNLNGMNYQHANEVVEGFDSVHEIEKYSTVIESNRNLIVGPSELVLDRESSNVAEQAKNLYNNQLLKKIFFCIGIIIVFITFCTILICVTRNCSLRGSRRGYVIAQGNQLEMIVLRPIPQVEPVTEAQSRVLPTASAGLTQETTRIRFDNWRTRTGAFCVNCKNRWVNSICICCRQQESRTNTRRPIYNGERTSTPLMAPLVSSENSRVDTSVTANTLAQPSLRTLNNLSNNELTLELSQI